MAQCCPSRPDTTLAVSAIKQDLYNYNANDCMINKNEITKLLIELDRDVWTTESAEFLIGCMEKKTDSLVNINEFVDWIFHHGTGKDERPKDKKATNSGRQMVQLPVTVKMKAGHLVLPRSLFLPTATIAAVKQQVRRSIGYPESSQTLFWDETHVPPMLRNGLELGNIPSASSIEMHLVIENRHEKVAQALLLLESRDIVEILGGVALLPDNVVLICAAVHHLLTNSAVESPTWSHAQKMMQSPSSFIDELSAFPTRIDEGKVSEQSINVASQIRQQMVDVFTWDAMIDKSKGAAALAMWVTAIIEYYHGISLSGTFL